MTEAVQLALITALGGVAVGSIPGTFAALAAARARRASERAEAEAKAAKTIGVETAHRIDGRMDELLELTRLTAFKAGVLQQKEHGEVIAAAVKASQPTQVVIAHPMRPEVERQERDAEKEK